ncbi:MAG: hypothetical protein ACRDHL_11690 [Candidatus Promineifilaceae bacterium]
MKGSILGRAILGGLTGFGLQVAARAIVVRAALSGFEFLGGSSLSPAAWLAIGLIAPALVAASGAALAWGLGAGRRGRLLPALAALVLAFLPFLWPQPGPSSWEPFNDADSLATILSAAAASLLAVSSRLDRPGWWQLGLVVGLLVVSLLLPVGGIVAALLAWLGLPGLAASRLVGPGPASFQSEPGSS